MVEPLYNPNTNDLAYIENKMIEMVNLKDNEGRHIALPQEFMVRSLKLNTREEADKLLLDAMAWVGIQYPSGK